MKKTGLLELQQGQKIKKLVVGKFRSPKNQKVGRRKIPQGQKIKKLGVGKFRKAKSTKNRPSGNSANAK